MGGFHAGRKRFLHHQPHRLPGRAEIHPGGYGGPLLRCGGCGAVFGGGAAHLLRLGLHHLPGPLGGDGRDLLRPAAISESKRELRLLRGNGGGHHPADRRGLPADAGGNRGYRLRAALPHHGGQDLPGHYQRGHPADPLKHRENLRLFRRRQRPFPAGSREHEEHGGGGGGEPAHRLHL